MANTVGPLAGIKVVEVASVVMGPYAGQLLGDMGAEVIKVEDRHGDTSRVMGAGPHPQLSGVALNLHRNKRSIVLDLEMPEAVVALRRLLADADVLITNMKPGSLIRMGIDAESLRADLPRLVYCEAHGFRSDSADADRPAFDDIIQALTGLPALNEQVVGEMAFVPAVIADKVSAMFIVNGVLAALVHRATSGLGQRVEVPMFDATLAFNLVEHLSGAAVPGEPPGYSRILTRNRGPHRTTDGWIAMLPYSEKNWRALYTAAGCPEKLDQPWHANKRTRLLRADEVYGELKQVISTRSSAEWLELCEDAGIPASIVPTLADIVDDGALHHGVLRETEHPIGVRYRQIAQPIVFSATPTREVNGAAPLLGEHGRALLAEAGHSADEIDHLIAIGATVEPS